MSQSDDESRDKRSKRAKRVSKDAADIKVLFKEIKHLREDVNHITERVEVSNMRLEINKNWPVVKFERARDQFEYNALCAIGNDLDLALSASTGDEIIRHIESARTKTLDHTVVLNVAKEYGWEVAVELPQSKSEGLSAFFEGLSSMKDQGSRADHAGDKAPTYQIENEIGLTVQREKETIPSYVTIVGDWDTMLITAHQGQIDDHLKGNQQCKVAVSKSGKENGRHAWKPSRILPLFVDASTTGWCRQHYLHTKHSEIGKESTST
ncbi:hypothetical protein C2G38_2166287 [Gigaspora rosea]|uniref:Uncharacterized protein n=1 Tax=Gigaspora rosea TaxID=44941 RepID=A0A397VZ51_9GLOM|nr:hypothetical protein C2G38_2166287 [Gigaspora rosea]